MSGFEKMIGRPGRLSTGALTVAARHRADDGTWPAVICLGKAITVEGFAAGKSVDVRLEMSPEEARRTAGALLNMAAIVE